MQGPWDRTTGREVADDRTAPCPRIEEGRHTHSIRPQVKRGQSRPFRYAGADSWRDWFQIAAVIAMLTAFYLSGSTLVGERGRLLRYSTLLAVTVATFAVSLTGRQEASSRADVGILGAAAAFLIVCAIGAVFSPERWESFQRTITFVVLILFSAAWVRANSPSRTAVCLYWATAVFSAICCVLSLIGAEEVGERMSSVGTNPNWAGGMLGLAVIVFLLGALAPGDLRWRLVLGAGAAMAAILLARTQSRTSILACAVALSVTAIVVKKLRVPLASVAVVGLAGAAFLLLFPSASGAVDAVKDAALRTDRSGDVTTGRLSSLQNLTWKAITSAPLYGTGLGGQGMEGVLGELGYITLLGKTGVLGFTSLVVWIVLVLRRLWTHAHQKASTAEADSVAAWAALTLFVYFVIMNCAEGYVTGVGNAVTPLMWMIGAYAAILGPAAAPRRTGW